MISKKDTKLQKAWMLICLIDKYEIGFGMSIIKGRYSVVDIQIGLELCRNHNDYWGETIANLFLEFTEEEREQIVERGWEIEQQIKD